MTLEDFSSLFLTRNSRVSELILKKGSREIKISLDKLFLDAEIDTLLKYRDYDVIQVSSNYAGLVIFLRDF